MANASAQSVAFINPGKSNEAFWVAVSQVMLQAARSLGMDLEIVYAERDRARPLEIAQEMVRRPAGQRPQYVIVANEGRVGPELLRITAGSGIQVFMAFSGLQEDQRQQFGKPRGHFKHWLGSLEPKAQDAGYLTARALIAQAKELPALRAPDGQWHMVALAGDRSTTVSIERNQGMRQAVEESADVVLHQEVYSDWRRDRAQEQASVLFQRFPHAKLVWAGSDQIAFGAMEALRQRGAKPGVDVLFSGINTSQEALDARKQGTLSALAGGHFMNGAWALVMLYDYARGFDFVAQGLELEFPMFLLLDERNIPTFEARFVQLTQRVDFKVFSKHHNRKLKAYRFDIADLLR